MKLERRLAKLLRRILNHPSAAFLVPVMHLQAEAYVSRGLIFQLQGDMTHAEHNLSQSVVILWAMNDPEALQTQRFLGELKFYEGDLASADELFASALRDPATPPREQALLLRNLGNIAYVRGDYSTCRNFLEQALSISVTLNETEFPARDLMNLSAIDFHRGDLERAIERTREALSCLGKEALAHIQGQLHANLGTFLAAAGRSDEARDHWRYAMEAFREGFFIKDAVQVMRNIALDAYQAGHLDRALRILQQAAADHAEEDALTVQIQVLTGRIYRWQRNASAALAVLDSAERIAEDLGETLLREAVLLEKCFIRMDQGRLSDAHDLLNQTDAAKKRRNSSAPSVFDLENELLLVQLYSALDRHSEATRCYRRLNRMVREYRKTKPSVSLDRFPTGESWDVMLARAKGIGSG